MKYILGALAAVAFLAGVAASQPASARCWWDGYAWHCYYPRHHGWWRHHYHHRAHYWRGYGWYRY
jgi:hypothetical protein